MLPSMVTYAAGLEIEVAANLAERWGYPRAVTERERYEGSWLLLASVSNTRRIEAIAWIVPLPAEAAAAFPMLTFAWHGIGAPMRRSGPGAVFNAGLGRWVEAKARALGAQRLYSLLPDELPPEFRVSAMRRYLRRFGYKSDELGCYKDL